MSDDLLEVLTRFHRDIVMPDVKDMIREAIQAEVAPLRHDILSHFDGLYQQIHQLRIEYHALVAGVQRLEEQRDSRDQPVARHEIDAIKIEIAALRNRIAELEAGL